MPSACNWVCVLGDFGRSPRMQYHTLSMATDLPDSEVHVIAYGGSKPLDALLAAKNVHISTIPELPAILNRLPRLLKLAFKVLHQLFWLLWMMLFRLPRPRNILLQTPPAIPTMAICWLAARLRSASLVIDWHNFGYTIMSLSYGKRHPIVRVAHSYELYWGRRADANFCVTKAMQQELQQHWGVSATVLYDRPPAFFQRVDATTAHALFHRLTKDLSAPGFNDYLSPMAAGGFGGGGMTVATVPLDQSDASGPARWRADRPAIVISSTSWTPDEDFSILMRAAELYDQLVEASRAAPAAAANDSIGAATTSAPGTSTTAMNYDRAVGAEPPPATGSSSSGCAAAAAAAAPRGASALPPLLLLITGKGPQKEHYLAQIRGLGLHHVSIRTLWLEAEDYPRLLGAADVGVSLHASSSGLDLPMKVVDMFGSGLPVCALSYDCIDELVHDGETGMGEVTVQSG